MSETGDGVVGLGDRAQAGVDVALGALEAAGFKSWLVIAERPNGKLVAIGPNGLITAKLDRTMPSNPTRDQTWASALMADVSQLVGVAIARVARTDQTATRFLRRKF